MSSAGCRILFVGAVEEGHRCLEQLVARGEQFVGIVSLQDSLAATTSGAVPFEDLARAAACPLIKVNDLNAAPNVAQVEALRPDLILVIGWTRLLGTALLRLPRLGAVGFHASLLPRYRGRAPVNWAIINGETETGNTMFFLDEGVDTGDIIAQRRIRIDEADTCATLYHKVADAALVMLEEHLPALKRGNAPRRPQDHALATVMPKRRPEDGVVDWRRSARQLYNWVRALTHPYPGAFSSLEGRRLFIWEAREAGPDNAAASPGAIRGASGEDLLVSSASGLLALRRVQWEGADEVPGAALRAHAGARFALAGEAA